MGCVVRRCDSAPPDPALVFTRSGGGEEGEENAEIERESDSWRTDPDRGVGG